MDDLCRTLIYYESHPTGVEGVGQDYSLRFRHTVDALRPELSYYWRS